MIEKILSPVSYEIWKMLDCPENWSNGNSYDDKGKSHTIYHKETHVCLWICNGSWFLEGYNTTIYSLKEDGNIDINGEKFKTKVPQIGLFDRHILWHKVKKVMKYLDNNTTIANDLREYNNSREM